MLDKEKAVTYEEAIDELIYTFVECAGSSDDAKNGIALGIVGAIARLFGDATKDGFDSDFKEIEDDFKKKAMSEAKRILKKLLEEE